MAGPFAIPGVQLGESLGRGAFGEVFRGRHEALGVEVAVKLVDVARLPPREQHRVLSEAQLMARLDHPNLLRVFNAGATDGHAYMVLELMDGGSCAGLHRLPGAAARNVAFQLGSAVQALHDARVLHRDIKPANCLRRARDERVKLADLGLAVEVATRQIPDAHAAGTIPFMAPELFETPPRFAPTSDIYALGMTLACLILEEAPYPRGPLPSVLPWILRGPRPSISGARPDLPGHFARLVERMISPRVEDRPASAGGVLVAMGTEAAPAVSEAGPAPSPARTVGPWIIGDAVYTSGNWLGFAVTHVRTGAAGRLMHLRETGPLAGEGPRILASAERASRLSHPRIVPVLDWGTWDDRAYVVTSARGCTIDELVGAQGPCDELTALRFAAQLAEGLASLHSRGLVFQTVDPGAAVVGADARSAQLSWPVYCAPAGTSSQHRIVVPRYAAPEALSGRDVPIDFAVDAFGLGALVFFILTGDAARRFSSSDEIRSRVRTACPEITAPTAVLVGDLMHLDPTQRPRMPEASERIAEILSRLHGDVESTESL